MTATQRRPFGALLRTYRVAAGLSQEGLAERAHLSQRTVSDLERGVTAAPYRETVTLLAAALELTESDRTELEDAVDRSRTSSPTHREPNPWSSDPLLVTKLTIPSVRTTLVPRPHLMERLQAGLLGPLTLLSAPAGSGKTTVLSAWRATAGRDVPLAWVSLDAGDNDPTRFWRYVAAALGRAHPGLSPTTEDILASPQLPSRTSLLTRIINAITAENVDIVLALDDYHLIEHQEIHAAIGFLLDHLPPTSHLLISSRTDPPLPLARPRAAGAVTELRAADLRFSGEEASIFFREVMDLPLPADAMAALEARTEGWIVGLQLAALSLQGRPPEAIAPFVAAFAGSHRYVVDYLVDEVLLRQPDEVQHFLLHTCVLERLCAALAATVIEGEDPPAESVIAAQEMLERLEHGNVFLIALDDQRRWYRYHHLFADALQQRQPAAVPDVLLLHRRASVWLERQGLMHSAIEHALAAEAYDRAADLVVGAAPSLYSRGELDTIAAWFESIPERVLQTRPQLCVLQTWFPIHAFDPDGAEQYLQQAEATLDTCTPLEARNLRGEIAVARANIRSWLGDAAGTIEQAQIALREFDDARSTSRSYATLCLGVAYLKLGPLRDSAEVLHDVGAANRSMNNAFMALLAAMFEVHAYRAVGAWSRAVATCEEAIRWSAQRSHPSPMIGSLYITLAGLLLEWGQLDAALQHATQGISTSVELEGYGRLWPMLGRLVLARIKRAQGDLDGSLAIVGGEWEQVAGQTTLFELLLDAFEAQVRLAQGDVEAASRLLRRVEARRPSLQQDLGPVLSWYAYELLDVTPVQLLIAQGRGARDPAPLHRVLDLVNQQRQEAERLGFLWCQTKALALRALALDALARGDEALAVLEQALVLAQPEGYVGLFADEGPPMVALLRRLWAQPSVARYVATLLSALGSSQIPGILPPVMSRGGQEPLTDRELDVLRLLAAGQSNPEIARMLYVEVNTVKTHVKSLYGKLGAHSRVEAVHRARELTLL
jgi:LuxR family maltose regulon positive regulatory protein